VSDAVKKSALDTIGYRVVLGVGYTSGVRLFDAYVMKVLAGGKF
jgi:hypothetical protein